MLIGGPLGEGSNAGSTNSELWGAEHSFLGMSGHSDAPKGAAYSIGNAGSTYNELWRAENSFLRMRRNSDAQQGGGMLIDNPL